MAVTPYYEDQGLAWSVIVGDAREKLAELPDASVQCVVTSPPYWGLRDYGVDGQLGLEPTPEAFVAVMVAVFREVRRVLKADGVCWLNLGDSYSGVGAQTGGTNSKEHGRRAERMFKQRISWKGLKPKDLVGIPWRVAFALQADGWYLRSDIIWAKPNPMPESVTDRPTKAHEYIFLLSKCERYYYDVDAIREPQSEWNPATNGGSIGSRGSTWHEDARGSRRGAELTPAQFNPLGRNCRTVWNIATQPYPDAHFATFPEALPERCIKAGSRIWDTVLDPFTGSGTTGQVAIQLRRNFVGIELSPAYAELARRRIGTAAPLFASEATA